MREERFRLGCQYQMSAYSELWFWMWKCSRSPFLTRVSVQTSPTPPGSVPTLDSSWCLQHSESGNWSTEIEWLPHQWWQPPKKPRFPALLFQVSTTGSANLSPACPPAPSEQLCTISKQWHRGHWGSAGQFPSVLLTSLSLPTELTNF